MKFTPDGGTVTVTARHTLKEDEDGAFAFREFIEIAVSDNGIGIKQEDQHKLFKPFSQIESNYSKNYEGTGLGLAMVNKLVELHNGYLFVESEFGKGSTFTFAIPVKQTIVQTSE